MSILCVFILTCIGNATDDGLRDAIVFFFSSFRHGCLDKNDQRICLHPTALAIACGCTRKGIPEVTRYWLMGAQISHVTAFANDAGKIQIADFVLLPRKKPQGHQKLCQPAVRYKQIMGERFAPRRATQAAAGTVTTSKHAQRGRGIAFPSPTLNYHDKCLGLVVVSSLAVGNPGEIGSTVPLKRTQPKLVPEKKCPKRKELFIPRRHFSS